MPDHKQDTDSIAEEMKRVRGDLKNDIDTIVQSSQVATDWQSYVKRYPWLCLGAAAAIGFIAVPKRVEIQSPDTESLLRLAKKNRLVVEANPKAKAKTSVVGGVFNFVANAAFRSAVAYMGQQMGRYTAAQQEASVKVSETAAERKS